MAEMDNRMAMVEGALGRFRNPKTEMMMGGNEGSSIVCMAEDCEYNKNGKHSGVTIQVGADVLCQNYSPKGKGQEAEEEGIERGGEEEY